MGSSISVVIPTYNRASLLEQAIRSALDQTRPPDEIIVVDDGSTDGTERMVTNFRGALRYVRQKNSGPSAARNHGIRMATGNYIALLDSDDLWVPDRLERQVDALGRHPELDILFGLEAKFTAERELNRIEIMDPAVWRCLNSVDCVVPDPLALLLKENFLPTSSVLFRRRCVEQVGYIDESLRQSEDYDYWFRFALQKFQFGFVNRVLCRRRLHAGNLVNEWITLTASTAEVLSRYLDCSPTLREEATRRLGGMYYDLGSRLLRQREFGRSLHYLRRASPGGTTRLIWIAKLAVARLFSRQARPRSHATGVSDLKP